MRERLPEDEAARLFCYSMIRQVRESRPGIISQLKAFPDGSTLDNLDEERAQWEMLLATMALDLGVLENLFPKDQADRLFKFSVGCLPEEQRDYALATIIEYNNRYYEDLAAGMNPFLAIGEILCGRWGLAGATDYRPGELFIAADQILAGALSVAIPSFLGLWKRIKLTYLVSSE